MEISRSHRDGHRLRDQAFHPARQIDYRAPAHCEKNAPVLLPEHLDLFARHPGNRIPIPDPAIFLHGPCAGPADVNIIWRADLPSGRLDDWKDIVSLMPPSSAEAISVPFAATKGWLAEKGDRFRLLRTWRELQCNPAKPEASDCALLLWLGADENGTRPVTSDELFPGCTIIVPSKYGGADEFGWEPHCETTVPDLGDIAFSRQRGRPAFRLHEGVLESWIAPTTFENDTDIHELQARVRGLQSVLSDDEVEQESPAQRAIALLRVLTSGAFIGDDRRILAKELVDGSASCIVKSYPVGPGLVIIGPRRPELILILSEGDASSRGVSTPVSLTDHTQHVLDEVKRFVNLCRVADESIRLDLEQTATLHDLGKCDRRFQALLHRDRVAAAAGPVLAKSCTMLTTTRERDRERKIAGVPVGWRHELLTLSLLVDANNGDGLLDGAAHRELVLHLIATHHGYCRAIAPLIDDPAPPPATISWKGQVLRTDNQRNWVRLDSGITDRFWRLPREFGWFGLAYMEALFRLADHRASALERVNLIAT